MLKKVDSMQFKHLFLTAITLLTLPFTISAQQEHTLFRHGGSIRTVAYSPVNSSLVASAGDNRAVKLWNLQNDTVTTLGHHTDTVNSIAFSTDGQLLASGGDDYTFKVWDVSRQREIESFQHITGNSISQIKAVTFSPNGQRLATAGVHVKLWDTRNWEEITTLRHDEWVWAVAFSADGKLLATGDANGQVNVWNLQSRQLIAQRQADSNAIYAVRFSPNNQILAGAGYQGQIKLWKVPNWQYLGTLRGNGTVHGISFSPDSRALASTGYESVNLWAVNIGENIATLTGHTDWVNTTAFSPNGNSLISGGADGTLRIWDVTSYRTSDRDSVRIIYFVPRGRNPQPGIWTKLDRLIRDVQRFYADQMQTHEFGRKTFTFETDENAETLVWQIDGQFRDWHYHTDTRTKVHTEVADQFDMSKHIYLIVVDISSEAIDNEKTCGVGGGNWFGTETLTRTRGGYAIIPASGNCFDGKAGVSVTAHELGHAFGLEHDFRNDAYVMSYGAAPNRLSKCTARWLDVNRFFNANQTAFNEPATIQMLTPSVYLPNARNLTLQFEVTDVDGIHQAQLLVPVTSADPAPGIKLHSCKDLNAQSSTLEFYASTLTAHRVNNIVLQVIDVHGNIARQDYALKADNSLFSGDNADVNRDGRVNVADLVLVASNFGKTVNGRINPNPDVNRDGIVNIADLILVASLLSEGSAAPMLHVQGGHTLTATDLQEWIRQSKNYDIQTGFSYLHPDTIEKGIAVLEQLLSTLVIPIETRLLANYPNPFNPETWIPYQLAMPSDVTLHIYSVNGALMRTLALGHQPAGIYRTRSRAAYWDGQNDQGEAVASGVYFYTLSTGDFTATRKMLIKK